MSDEAREIGEEVRNLKENGHFTKMYRTLSERCTKVLEKLDAMDVSGRSDLREERRRVINEVKNIAEKELPTKVHRDGQFCNNCEIQRL